MPKAKEQNGTPQLTIVASEEAAEAPAKTQPNRPPPVDLEPAEKTPALDSGLGVLEQKQANINDLKAPENYLNRELTWLAFNYRVLTEARDHRKPVLERVKFLAIAANNLDEFFMKRIGGLKQQVGAGVHDKTVDGRTPAQQIVECSRLIQVFQDKKRRIYKELIGKLAKYGIDIMAYSQLSEPEQKKIRRYYSKNIFPLLTPLAMDPAHPFPFISNLSLNLLVTLHHPNEQRPVMARLKVPVGSIVPRFIPVSDSEHRFVPVEDVMANNLDLLFPDMKVESCEIFRVTRNAITETNEDAAGDLMAMIETELRDRKFAPIVRLETQNGINPVHRGMLAAELGLDEVEDVYEIDSMIGMSDLMQIAGLDIPDLKIADHHPVHNIKLQDNRSIFHIIRDTGPILLQHPYEAFTSSVERFVREASQDPKVQGIKMTLYRTSADTKIIEYLIDAARNGKQVAVAVELKARFDEAANITWAQRMEEVGVHVTYGVVGLKTHSKIILVVRKDYSGLRRYAHIGTGNYHAGTARLYSDMGLLTCDDNIGKDLTELFNYLTTGFKPKRHYRKLLTSPKSIKKSLIDKIDREIGLHSDASPGLIRLKMNGLEDSDITEALYKASQAGVKVELLVRDTCRLRPGIEKLSETITVTSIVGRFLEHTRIYYFQNGGDEEYFIGSADLMRRNLERRVEVLTPVEEPELQAELQLVLDTQLSDRRNVWDMESGGTYKKRKPARGTRITKGCQDILIELAEKRDTEANRLRKRKLRSISGQPIN